MKFSKRSKKIIAAVLGTSIFFFGANVYAQTALNTNIVEMITTGVKKIGPTLSTNANMEISKFAKEQKSAAEQFLANKTDEVLKELETTTESELKQAKEQLEEHYTQLVNEADETFDAVVVEEKENIKKSISTKLNTAKSELTTEFEAKLQEKLDQIVTNSQK